MRPRTKIQKEVDSFSEKLHYLSEKDVLFAKNSFRRYFYTTKKEFTCFVCNHKWKNTPNINSKVKQICPNCGKAVYPMESKKRTICEREYIIKVETYKNYQLFRTFKMNIYAKVGYEEAFYITEINQHWIREDGKFVIRSVMTNNFHYGWNLSTTMEIRHDHNKYYVHTDKYFPNKKFLKIVKRNGYKRKFHEFHPSWFCQLILGYNKAETLLKAGQIKLFQNYGRSHDEINNYWSSIKICIRNKYIIEKPRDWFDHLESLIFFNKDIHNPKYICPENFEYEHQRLNNKRQAILDKEKEEDILNKLRKEEKAYAKKVKKYLDLVITNGVIEIKVIPSIIEMYREGKELHHCVYSNEYYKKNNSIILSARKNNKRLETIQFSIKEKQILQSRGFFNKDTEYHDDIIKLVNSNVNLIK